MPDTDAENSQAECITIRDGAQRRRFIRRGAAFVAAAGVISAGAGRSALAADCDRGGPGGEKPKHGGNGSDSDAGANADPTGCGRKYEDRPKISKTQPDLPRHVAVVTVKAG